eukprot:FR735627.1.p1 GENE.FR735627.1~~FR735627.1.p1  ORF type:complete len:180 (+),score=32.83 FR735627.1:571-1110(+)
MMGDDKDGQLGLHDVDEFGCVVNPGHSQKEDRNARITMPTPTIVPDLTGMAVKHVVTNIYNSVTTVIAADNRVPRFSTLHEGLNCPRPDRLPFPEGQAFGVPSKVQNPGLLKHPENEHGGPLAMNGKPGKMKTPTLFPPTVSGALNHPQKKGGPFLYLPPGKGKILNPNFLKTPGKSQS